MFLWFDCYPHIVSFLFWCLWLPNFIVPLFNYSARSCSPWFCRLLISDGNNRIQFLIYCWNHSCKNSSDVDFFRAVQTWSKRLLYTHQCNSLHWTSHKKGLDLRDPTYLWLLKFDLNHLLYKNSDVGPQCGHHSTQRWRYRAAMAAKNSNLQSSQQNIHLDRSQSGFVGWRLIFKFLHCQQTIANNPSPSPLGIQTFLEARIPSKFFCTGTGSGSLPEQPPTWRKFAFFQMRSNGLRTEL